MDLVTQLLLVSGNVMSVLGFLAALVLLSRVRSRPTHPGTTLAWLLGLIFLPVLALPLYLSFGSRRLLRRAGRKEKLHLQRPVGVEGFEPEGPVQTALFSLKAAPPATAGNQVELLTSGEVVFERLLHGIQNAKRSIHFATFILTNDESGRALLAALAVRAREGVEVRLLLDGAGSFWLGRSALKELRDAGGRVATFLPVLPFRRRWAANHRLHRKLYMFDGWQAVIGGHNLAAEYLGPTANDTRWTDAALLVTGPAVQAMEEVFRADWAFADCDDMLPAPEPAPTASDGQVVQVVASGPDAEGDPFHDVLLAAMTHAQKRLWIVTPYFVPDETILRLLCLMARLGRDVRVIIPARSNHMLADLARRAALRELLNSGATVYLYKPRMLHAKILLIDDAMASVGSSNMDMRSFFLNFEVALFAYSPEAVRTVAEHIESLKQRSELLVRKPIERNVLIETAENVAQLLSPLI
jgi:cardiolipin synthase